MKNNIDNFMKKSFVSLNEVSNPTQEQKQDMLNNILFQANIQNNNQNISKKYSFKNLVFVYPWRFALGVSTIQAIVLTAVFGSKYTNLVLQFLGR